MEQQSTETRLEELIQDWRKSFQSKAGISTDNLEELESHLREEIEYLKLLKLTSTEAFLIAKYRLGDKQELAKEYKKVNKLSYLLNSIQPFLLGLLSYIAFDAFFYKSMILINIISINLGYYDVNLVSSGFVILLFTIVFTLIYNHKYLNIKYVALTLIVLSVLGKLSFFNSYYLEKIVDIYQKTQTYSIISHNVAISFVIFYSVILIMTILVFYKKRTKKVVFN